MDDGNERPPRPSSQSRRRPPQNTRGQRQSSSTRSPSGPRPQNTPGAGNGYRSDPSTPNGHTGSTWDAFTGQFRRLRRNVRALTGDRRVPREGEWRASDFHPDELEAWDQDEAVPFAVSPSDDDGAGMHPAASAYSQPRPGSGSATPRDWNDEWDAPWETGTWDTGWATGLDAAPSVDYAADPAADGADSGFWAPGRGTGRRRDASTANEADPSGTMARLAGVHAPLGRVARARILFRRRPGAALVLAFFLLGFMLTCVAPLVPLMRLGYDAADAARRVSTLQAMLAGGATQLTNATKLKEAQAQVDGIQRDLYEINGAVSLIGAPLGAISPQIRNYRVLVTMGYNLVTAADEGLQVAQIVLTPLQGGALAASGSPGLTPADMQQARSLLADAQTHIESAIALQHQLDPASLPAQIKPGTKVGSLLAQLPASINIFGELNTLLNVAPSLLGIGQPATYLVLAMDRSELRPGGGFQGNFGFLTLDGGKQSAKSPLSLQDVYKLDDQYFTKSSQNADANCALPGPQPPNYYWWWPYRCFSTQYGWGLRDANLSPDFPTNARTDIQIAQDSKWLPNNTPIQGVIAFTPTLIAQLLAATGPLPMPQYNVTVTPSNLEHEIHEFQEGSQQTSETYHKAFTHDLSSALLDRIKTLHGSQLSPIFKIAEDALAHKDLQLYFADPRAELILNQLGLASSVHTGGGDGFFVVDTNDGGNKANTYVTEKQTDVVTLLPDGGALHHLQIVVTYDKQGSVYEGTTGFEDYSDVQRTYLPGSADILGYTTPWAGFSNGCSNLYSTITDCAPGHTLDAGAPLTTSDVPGRTMVMEPFMILCGQEQSLSQYQPAADFYQCYHDPQVHTQTNYITWYTPHAYTASGNGHGTYSELVEKQPGTTTIGNNGQAGSQVQLTVYVSTSQLHATQPNPSNTTPNVTLTSSYDAQNAGAFLHLVNGLKPVFDGPLVTNQRVNFSF